MRPWKAYVVCAAALLAGGGWLLAQEQGPLPDSSTTVGKPRKPASDTDSKSGDDSNLPKIPSQYSRKDHLDTTNLPQFSTNVDVVTLDVSVLDNKGHFIPGIPAANFRVLEDNVPQQIQSINPGEAPMTIALVIEFSASFQQSVFHDLVPDAATGLGFCQHAQAGRLYGCDRLRHEAGDPDRFHHRPAEDAGGAAAADHPGFFRGQSLSMPSPTPPIACRPSKGRKAILLISTGIDTFSRITYDQARKKLQEAGVPVYVVSLMQAQREMMDSQMGSGARMDFLQADNAMRTFAKETGGQAYFPRFQGEYGQIFQNIQQALRSQYVLSYSPTNKAHDGSYRKIKIELVNPATNEPLALKDEKGKPFKYSIISKSGYKAPRAVE